jgi:peptidoglycan L-alanyl-D-glutamate endopeptidase CwlK
MTLDKITLDRIQLLHPSVRDEAVKIFTDITAALKGRAMCRFTYTLRTFAEQAAIYAQGRTKLYDAKGNRLGIVSNAPAGRSYHNYGLAIDIALVVDTNKDGKFDTGSWDTVTDFDGDGISDWTECVKIFKSYGWSWGGDFKTFKDRPHFEKTFGRTTTSLLADYNAKKYLPSTEYVKVC